MRPTNSTLGQHFTIARQLRFTLDDVSEEIKPYDPEGDCALYADRPTSWLHLVPGQVAVFFPEDAHAPVIGEGKIRKMIAKVKIA